LVIGGVAVFGTFALVLGVVMFGDLKKTFGRG